MADKMNIKLGACDVTFKETALGYSIGGCELSYEPEYIDVKPDQLGSNVEKFLVGEKLMVKVPMAEFTFANLEVAFPQGVRTANTKIGLGTTPGKRASVDAGLLQLHPTSNAASNRSEDIGIYLAYVSDTVTIGMNNEGVKLVEVTFEALVDPNRSDGSMLGIIGDSLS